MILGRCYAIQKKSEVNIFDFTTTFIFKTTFDLQVFIHNPGEAHHNSIPWNFEKFLTNEKFIANYYQKKVVYIVAFQEPYATSIN